MLEIVYLSAKKKLVKKITKKGCNNKSTKCITHNLWDELDQHIHQFFEKVKLQDLVRGDIN